MALGDWSGRHILLLWLAWPAITLAGAAALDLIDVRVVVARGAAVGLRVNHPVDPLFARLRSE
jgi:hypothetical protein